MGSGIVLILAWGFLSIIFGLMFGKGSDIAAMIASAVTLIGIFYFFIQSKIEENKERVKAIEDFRELLLKDGYCQDYFYQTPDFYSVISIDKNKKIISLGEFDGDKKALERFTLSANQILNIELLEDGKRLLQMNSDLSGTLTAAAIGGLAFGGAGAVVGAIANQKNTNVTNINLAFQTSDLDTPYVIFNFLGNIPVMAGSPEHKNTLQAANEWAARVKALQNQKEKVQKKSFFNNSESKKSNISPYVSQDYLDYITICSENQIEPISFSEFQNNIIDVQKDK